MTAPPATAPAVTPHCAARGEAALIDAFGRRIDYLRVSLTERCNLRCGYCVGNASSGAPELAPGPVPSVVGVPARDCGPADPGRRAPLTFAEIERFCAVAAREGVRHVRLTGGEPLLAGDVAGLVRRLRALPGIDDVALTSNGTLLAAHAQGLADAGLSRVNVSLDSLDPDEYARATGGGRLTDALAGVQAALAVGLKPVKLNAVVTGSPTQDLLALASLSQSAPLHVRFIERMSLGLPAVATLDTVPRACVSPWANATCERIGTLAAAAGLGALEPVPEDERPEGWGPARVWRFPGAVGTVGFISASNDGSCARCSRLRLTADGHLRPCLLGACEIDVAGALRTGSERDVSAVLRAAVAAKPATGCIGAVGARTMTRIGG